MIRGAEVVTLFHFSFGPFAFTQQFVKRTKLVQPDQMKSETMLQLSWTNVTSSENVPLTFQLLTLYRLFKSMFMKDRSAWLHTITQRLAQH